MKKTDLFAFGVGIVLGAAFTSLILLPDKYEHSQNVGHQTTRPDEEYHVHADFQIYIKDTKVDLARDEFMTTGENEPHKYVHLHDNNGEIIHIHKDGFSLADFLNSVSVTLTDSCLTVSSETYCTNDDEQLSLYVNGSLYKDAITSYEPKDEDAVLLYYGEYDSEKITRYLSAVKDDACYYSGTCPERGVAPPESCGLTCDI